MTPTFKAHCVDTLREQCKQESMRPFQARGSNLVRCSYCLMSKDACFCHLRKVSRSPIEFILLFHRDEIHKPTNSGRLIADLFPQDTKAYIWSRTEPSASLLKHLQQIQENCTILFPNTEIAKSRGRKLRTNLPSESAEQKHTFIILDGTWKQASKMFHQSEWLKHIPHFEISSEAKRSFLVRHSSHNMQFATAEVSAMLLDTLGHLEQSQRLLHYYQAFNQRCLNSRRRLQPKQTTHK